jgi:hypothetical protein
MLIAECMMKRVKPVDSTNYAASDDETELDLSHAFCIKGFWWSRGNRPRLDMVLCDITTGNDDLLE